MTQPLIVSLTDQQFAALTERAASAGVSPEACLLEMAGLGGTAYSDACLVENPRAELRRHFGKYASGDSDFGNNERIDADLARMDADGKAGSS